MLVAWLDNPVGKASLANDLSLESVGFSGSPGGARSEHGLLAIESSVGVRVSNCQFLIAATSGLLVQDSAATIEDCTFDQLRQEVRPSRLFVTKKVRTRTRHPAL